MTLLQKPFSAQELVKRVRAVLDATGSGTAPAGSRVA
jgi:DNA-binding response OmpR family regulator